MRAARHYVQQHAGPAGHNLTDLNLPVLRASYVCSENRKVNWTACSKIASHIFRGKNRFEVHEMRSSGSRTAKICSSVSGK